MALINFRRIFAAFCIAALTFILSGCAILVYTYNDTPEVRALPGLRVTDSLTLQYRRTLLDMAAGPDTTVIIAERVNDDTIKISRLDQHLRTMWSQSIGWEWEAEQNGFPFKLFIADGNVAYTQLEHNDRHDSVRMIGIIHDMVTGTIIHRATLAQDVISNRAESLITSYQAIWSKSRSHLLIYRIHEYHPDILPDTLHTYLYNADFTPIGERILPPGIPIQSETKMWRSIIPDGYGNMYEINIIDTAIIALTRHNYQDGSSHVIQAKISNVNFSDEMPWTTQPMIRFATPTQVEIAIAKNDIVYNVLMPRRQLSGVGMITFDFDSNTAHEAIRYSISDSLSQKIMDMDQFRPTVFKSYRILDGPQPAAKPKGYLFFFEASDIVRPGRPSSSFGWDGNGYTVFSGPSLQPLPLIYSRFRIMALAFDNAGNPLWQRSMQKEQHSGSERVNSSFSAHYAQNHVSMIYSAEKDETVVRAIFPLDGSSQILKDRILGLDGGTMRFSPENTIWISDTDVILVTMDKYFENVTFKRISIPISK